MPTHRFVAFIILGSGVLCLIVGTYLAASGRGLPLGAALLAVGVADTMMGVVFLRRRR